MLLADALADRLRPAGGAVQLRTATVASATANRVVLNLAGATVSDVPFLAGYAPVAGHTVLVLQAGPSLVVLGRPAP